MKLQMQFTQAVQPEIDKNAPLIYLWEITNVDGVVVGRYVGKASRGARRPTRDYKDNVDALLEGKPYHIRGSDYRRVHHAMANAVRAGHAMRLHFLCNVLPEQDINAMEHHYIEAYGCLNGPVGLNGKREKLTQAKDKTTMATVQDNAAPVVIHATSLDAEWAQQHPRLEAFRTLVEAHFPQMQPTRGKHRYAFSVGTQRIVRAEQLTPAGRVNVKLVLSSKPEEVERQFNWDSSPEQVLEAIKHELHMYEQYCKKPCPAESCKNACTIRG